MALLSFFTNHERQTTNDEPMILKDVGEHAFIEGLRKRTATGRRVRIGIGDDTAVIANGPKDYLLFTTDMLVEGVHFKRGERDARGIGHKALAVSVSDIAAMGGRPTEAVISVGVPPKIKVKFLNDLYSGIQGLARQVHVDLVGGDLVRSVQLVVNIALLGTVKKKHLVTRKEAVPGDELWVTGRLGGNIGGRILRIQPRLDVAKQLARKFKPHAMLDLSDGLSTDLANLCSASHVGARIELERLPIHPAARKAARGRGVHARLLAFAGGEDFELLFAMPKARAVRLAKAKIGVSLNRIGKIVKGRKIRVYENGRLKKIKKIFVWKHF